MKTPVDREEGFYWVLNDDGEPWRPAWWHTDAYYGHPEFGTWYVLGNEMGFEDAHFAEIGRKIEALCTKPGGCVCGDGDYGDCKYNSLGWPASAVEEARS